MFMLTVNSYTHLHAMFALYIADVIENDKCYANNWHINLNLMLSTIKC